MNWDYSMANINRLLNNCRKTLNEVFYGMTIHIPFYKTWRRNVLREKDITDIISGGV